MSSITGEKGIWIPIQFWDEGEEKRDHKSEDVRGEKLLELEVEVDDVDEDVEVERPVHGPRCVMEKVWKKLEKIGLVVQGKRQHVEKVKDLDNGNDGDL